MKKVNPFGLQAITNALEFLLQKMESVFIYHNSHIINDLWLFSGESCLESRAIHPVFFLGLQGQRLGLPPMEALLLAILRPITGMVV